MRILASNLQLSARHERVERQEVRESLRVWGNAPQAAAPAPKPGDQPPCAATTADVKLLLLQMLIEQLTGRKMKLADLEGLITESEPPPDLPDPARAQSVQANTSWGAVYDREEIHVESEQMQFAATGVVLTADGREITLALSLTMSREFMTRSGLQVRAGAALKDPLVLNFDGNAAQLTDRKFSFDLDADGTKEEVPMLAPTSAFLALDRDGDGKINDGSELFGTASGNGFADLAAYDLDRNGWIDESDPVFNQLKLWLPGAIQSGAVQSGALTSLRERNVGALYLGAVDSTYELKRGEELDGQVRSTGLYLEEDGSAGTLQQVDLKI
jgi:hypothetical protein